MTEMRELHVYDCALMRCSGVRLVAVIALIAGGLLVTSMAAPTVARAEPETCPPVCDRIPDTAWIPREAIPLGSTYHWPSPAASATAMTGAAMPRFRFEEVCATSTLPYEMRDAAVSSRATVDRPQGQWQMRAEVVHWRGDTWRGGQYATSTLSNAAAALRGCQQSAASESPSVTVDEPNRLSAVVSGPTILHTYLVAHPENSTISELTLWASDPPQLPFPIISDAAVLDAMSASMCAAYLGSC
jgi:hypothetical protein